jgi:hypothetical protein
MSSAHTGGAEHGETASTSAGRPASLGLRLRDVPRDFFCGNPREATATAAALGFFILYFRSTWIFHGLLIDLQPIIPLLENACLLGIVCSYACVLLLFC